MRFEWTAEFVARLTELWLAGRSATLIAKELGGDLSRNSIIGKVHRLNLQRQEDATRIARKAAGTRAQPGGRPKPPKPPPAPKRPPEPRPEPLERPPEAFSLLTSSRPVDLMGLKPTTCRWPCWPNDSEERLYCGAYVEPGTTYCECHRAINMRPYQPPFQRQFNWIWKGSAVR
jgi:GcrA cell cycle regulator